MYARIYVERTAEEKVYSLYMFFFLLILVLIDSITRTGRRRYSPEHRQEDLPIPLHALLRRSRGHRRHAAWGSINLPLGERQRPCGGLMEGQQKKQDEGGGEDVLQRRHAGGERSLIQ